MHLVLTGNTGSGKTTLGRALAERLNVPLISSGEIARQLSNDDPSTKLALAQGAMAPEQPMRVAVRQRIEEADIQHGGWVLDGFPRTPAQLVCLLQWSAAMPSFVHVDLDAWQCVERLCRRNREHDNPDAIAKRLASYEGPTTEMLAILDGGGVLTCVDGAMPTDEQAEFVLR